MSDYYTLVAGRCVVGVWSQGGWRKYQCHFKGKVEREGKLYCTIHDPERVKEKDKERTEKWDAERVIARRARAIGWLGPRVLRALQRLHEGRLAATATKQYDGCEEVAEIIRIAKEEGWTYN
jgi:hypothetical protein